MTNNISTCVHKFNYYCYCLVCAAFYFISIFYIIVSFWAVLWSYMNSTARRVSFTHSHRLRSYFSVLQWEWFINHIFTTHTHYKQCAQFSNIKCNQKIWWSFFICQTHMYRDNNRPINDVSKTCIQQTHKPSIHTHFLTPKISTQIRKWNAKKTNNRRKNEKNIKWSYMDFLRPVMSFRCHC